MSFTTRRPFVPLTLLMLLLSAVVSGPAAASPDEAKAMAEAAHAYVTEHGFDTACPLFEDVSNTDWQKDDMYVFMLDRDSIIICNGSGVRKLDGVPLRGVLDASGRDLFSLYETLSSPAFVKYDFLNPATGAVEQKISWIIPTSSYILGVGTYKK